MSSSRVTNVLVPALTLAAGLVGGWLAKSYLHPPPAAPDVTEAARLLTTDREFAQMSAERGAAAAFYHFLAEDAVQLPAGADPVNGRELIRQRLPGKGQATLTWEPKEGAVSRAGDLGYTWGTYESITPVPDGPPKVIRGKYTNVWRKGPDDRWRVVLDIGNVQPPAP